MHFRFGLEAFQFFHREVSFPDKAGNWRDDSGPVAAGALGLSEATHLIFRLASIFGGAPAVAVEFKPPVDPGLPSRKISDPAERCCLLFGELFPSRMALSILKIEGGILGRGGSQLEAQL
jgi:hypothetical protein